jgi:hypothetical protein
VSRNPPFDEGLTAAEERLLTLLLLLQAENGRPAGSLAETVMRKLRWQRVVREIAHALAGLATAVSDGIFLLFGLGRDGGRRA